MMNPKSNNFSHSEIISAVGIHTNHFEIWYENNGKKKKLAMAYKKENADLIVMALQCFDEWRLQK